MDIKKIPLESLLIALESLYDEGVDFIDLKAKRVEGEDADILEVNVLPEYYATGEEDEEEDMESFPKIEKTFFNDDTLEDLI